MKIVFFYFGVEHLIRYKVAKKLFPICTFKSENV